MSEAGQAPHEHVHSEAQGMAPVLEVALSHALQMSGEEIHEDKSIPVDSDIFFEILYF